MKRRIARQKADRLFRTSFEELLLAAEYPDPTRLGVLFDTGRSTTVNAGGMKHLRQVGIN